MEILWAGLVALAPLIVLFNCIMICSLVKKIDRFEKALARYEERGHRKLREDTMEALTLLRTGKIEEAKVVAERIVNS